MCETLIKTTARGDIVVLYHSRMFVIYIGPWNLGHPVVSNAQPSWDHILLAHQSSPLWTSSTLLTGSAEMDVMLNCRISFMLVLKSVKCCQGGWKNRLIQIIFEILSLEWHQYLPYTKHHHMNLISLCQHSFCQSWLIYACHLFLRWPTQWSVVNYCLVEQTSDQDQFQTLVAAAITIATTMCSCLVAFNINWVKHEQIWVKLNVSDVDSSLTGSQARSPQWSPFHLIAGKFYTLAIFSFTHMLRYFTE